MVFSVCLKAFQKPTSCILVLEFKFVCAQLKDKRLWQKDRVEMYLEGSRGRMA